MLHKARRALESIGIKPGGGVFSAIQGLKSVLVDPIRRRAMARRGRNQESAPPFPVHVPQAWNALLAKHGLSELGTSDQHGPRASSDYTALGLWIVCKLLEFKDHRRKFPKALSGGINGEFCSWLGSQELPNGLTSEMVRSHFAGRPGDRVLRYIDDKEWVLRTLPLALTPAGRHGILDWLLGTTVKHLGEVNRSDVLWFALERAEDSTFGLAPTWLRQPSWQAHWPLGLTTVGAGQFLHELKTRHPSLQTLLPDGLLGLDQVLSLEDQARLVATARFGGKIPSGDPGPGNSEPEWVNKLAKENSEDEAIQDLVAKLRQDHAGPNAWKPGLNIFGHCSYWSGVGEAQRLLRQAVDQAGGRSSVRDVPADWRFDQPTRPDFLGVESYDSSVFCIPLFTRGDRILPRSGLNRKPGIRRIAYWYWELEVLPRAHAKNARFFDEIWAATRFVGEAIQAAVPDKPVRVVLPGVELGEVQAVERSKYGISQTDFVVLFMFDVASVIERKNPHAVVEAFRRSLGTRRDARLVIKISRPEFDPDGVRKLREAVAAVNGIVIDQHVSRAEAYGIMDLCDCYISLHRSEGYGITLAEAMLLGKTTIATGYSGNMDFMAPDYSFLVPYKLATIDKKLPYYPRGCRWAEADVDAAASHLLWAYENPALAKKLGDKARTEIGRILSLRSYGERVLSQLQASREGINAPFTASKNNQAAA